VNGIIKLAIWQAIESFAGGALTDYRFNLAGFSDALKRMCNLKGEIDGALCRAILLDRDDVRMCGDGCHFILVNVGS